MAPEIGEILVVDDEPYITDLLVAALGHEGFAVDVASTGTEALRKVRTRTPALVMLDVMLPDLSGTEVCRRLREEGNGVPVVFLTARDDTEDKVEGLRLADDYVTKPFSLVELVARVRAVLRRAVPDGELDERMLRFADLSMNIDTHEVWRQGVAVELTATEFNLLRFLLENARRVLSKSEILDNVWDYGFSGDINIVETYISYLRKKLDEFDPPLIHTVRRVGYSLRLPKGTTAPVSGG
ncbi:MAG TPA: response regulator transcription factor [Acidimicrobiales bacterium]|nr:response regulator transcription factor [Acidimicrobiales bacterium]